MKYQPEIDGLRAVAVLPVVLFHSGLPGFSGGFVGVDVFFVISGYLITTIIKGDIEEERFSLLHFYERRIRRIIPALLLVVCACLAAGLLLFLPYQLENLAYSAINTLTFTSNLWFWKQSGYFSAAAHLEPLLHTWSLAVEEQYYLFFPLGVWLLARLRIPLLPVVVAVFVGSLALAEIMVHRAPSATFYLLPTRAWELMLGAMLALGAVPAVLSRRLREGLASAGLVLILYPVFFYTADTAFPGLNALPACLGAGLIIVAGKAGGGTVIGLIGSRLPVAIGLISYSLYLWHWPVLVFSRQMLVTTDLGAGAAAAGIALSFVLAWLTWRFVEAPFRDKARISPRGIFKAGAAAALLAGGAAAAMTSGLPGRFDGEVLRLSAGQDDAPAMIRTCMVIDAGDRSCPIGAEAPPSFAVWGDSFSAAIGGAVERVAKEREQGGRLFASGGCPPGLNAPSPNIPAPDRAKCRERNRSVLAGLTANESIRSVILIAHWDLYLKKAPEQLLGSLEGTASQLRRAGKEVIILGGVPAPEFDVPWVSAMSSHLGKPMPANPAGPDPDPRLVMLAERTGARLIVLSPPFCGSGRCAVAENGKPLFMDRSHVSEYANRALLAPYLMRSGLLAEGSR